VAVCHAGHPLGLLVRADGQVSELGRPGTLLGAFERPTLHTSTHRLARGDGIVLYTDGVTEARSSAGFYGEARLAATVGRHRGSAHGLTYRLLDDVVAFQSGTTADDIVIVALHVPLAASVEGSNGADVAR
jgi:serine phosphatase RsbU (regulator of sigma subunit)